MGHRIQKRRVLINAIMSVMQVAVNGVLLFVLYRFLLNTIGIERLGIWSVVLATTSIANIANLGLSASVIKFVAKYLARGEDETISNLIQTSAISIGLLTGLLLLIGYCFANWLLSLVIPGGNLKDALSILPYALVSLWIMMVASVFQAGLDGYQRIDTRSKILIFTTSFNLILCFLLVPKYGLIGLAYAHIAQATLVLLGSWVMLRRELHLLPIIPYKWNRKVFKEIVGYGLNFQIISISQMLCDPTTKALLTKFGGLAMVGFYEMASRMILQLRSLIVSANQVLVPAIADLQERNPDFIQNIYRDNYRLMFYIALPFYTMVIVLAPSISELWIGHYESIFVIFSILLAVNLVINTLSGPAYFSYLGIGELRWNTLGHVITAIMNAVLGFMVGYILGGLGVVIAWIFSSITGSLIILVSYHHNNKVSLREILPSESKYLAIGCVIAIPFAFLIQYRLNHTFSTIIIFWITIFTFSIVILIPLYLHPMCKRLLEWGKELMNKKAGA